MGNEPRRIALRPLAISLLLILTISGVAAAQRGATAPCRRPPAKQFAAGAIVTISETRTFPCTIILQEGGVELRADPAGTIPNILRSVARDSRGRYYTTGGFGQVNVWGPDGKVIKTFGREGSGPGEFAKGMMTFSVDPADNLYIRDNHLRWFVFGPDYKLLREVRANGVGMRPEAATFIAPLTLLTSELPYGSNGGFFSVFDFSGKASSAGGDTPPILRAFGEIPAAERGRNSYQRIRRINAPVAGAFWAGPPEATGRGYELQLLTLDGAVLRTIRRSVPWFKPGSDVEPAAPQEDREVGTGFIPKPPTAIITARFDGTGLLFVVTRVTSSRWNPTLRETGDMGKVQAAMQAGLDLYYEVIDVDAGVVLASTGPIPYDRASNELPMGWFGTGWSGYRIGETSDALPVVKMIEVRLGGH